MLLRRIRAEPGIARLARPGQRIAESSLQNRRLRVGAMKTSPRKYRTTRRHLAHPASVRLGEASAQRLIIGSRNGAVMVYA